MKFLKTYFTVLCLLLYMVSCTEGSGDSGSAQSLDYASLDLWYDLESDTTYDVDVFYILQTCIADYEDENGVVCHYADVTDPEQRAEMEDSYILASDIFAAESNYYAPYYRQISLNSFIEGDSVVSERFPFAMYDISAAFDYFINNLNDNRPFILAGYSQGGKGVVELLKDMPEQVLDRMIAAYVIGYRVTEEDLECGNIVAAQSADDTSVTISYNSVENLEGVASLLWPTEICINPISWRVDSQPIELMEGVTVEVDTENNILLVNGLDSQLYFSSDLATICPLGNYHRQELLFYQESLRENVATRIEAFNNL